MSGLRFNSVCPYCNKEHPVDLGGMYGILQSE